MKLELKITPQLKTEAIQSLVQKLEDGEKERFKNALNFWHTKPHQHFSIEMNQLKMLFGSNPNAANQHGALEKPHMVKGDFVMLSEDEMSKVDIDEKVGIRFGDCIFIGSNTPQEYISMIVMNLLIVSGVESKDQEIMELLRSQGIDIDDVNLSRHWTANLFDIIIAEKYLSTEQFNRYLKWRKEIERTEFFVNPDMHDLMTRMLAYTRYKRTTHPEKRQKYGRLSWRNSGIIMGFRNEIVDKFGRDFLMSRSDVIFRKLSEVDEFEPETMMRTLSFILNNANGGKIDFDGHGDLDRQAYLLSEDNIGKGYALLKTQGEGSSEYKLARSYGQTIEALRDRILFFYREAIKKLGEHNDVSIALASALKNRSSLLMQGENLVTPVDINSPTAQDDIARQKEGIQEKLDQARQMLEEYEELEIKIQEKANSDNPAIIPASIASDKMSLMQIEVSLRRQLESLSEASAMIAQLYDLRQRQGSLLAQVELGNPVPPPLRLKS